MEAVKLFEKRDVPVDWEYDGEAETLYISFGLPKPATGIDAGEGVIIRCDEHAREVVGLTRHFEAGGRTTEDRVLDNVMSRQRGFELMTYTNRRRPTKAAIGVFARMKCAMDVLTLPAGRTFC
jgi:uncharacterized protein YuzE